MKNMKRLLMVVLAAIMVFSSVSALAWEPQYDPSAPGTVDPSTLKWSLYDAYLTVSAPKTVVVYNGKARELPVSLSYNGRELVKGVDYDIDIKYYQGQVEVDAVNAGEYSVEFTITNKIVNELPKTFDGTLVIRRASSKLTAAVKSKIYKASKIADGGAVLKTGLKGAVPENFKWWGKNFDANKAGFKFNYKTGRLYIPATLAKGNYTLCFQNMASENYLPGNRLTITIKIK